ncbi:Mitogen-activated kinase kinase kinase [Olea europaea subsp. europaea]|uniref:Mitogen-activated kinase kinase kinase n=1 Tax=Olea europaea subsp. europaea TaxID=158383 RepID=A0A8S0RHR6_OLEEU|nr:Mitogen-activated kinase kinase kinase [Olea europaea subsp. europaea]
MHGGCKETNLEATVEDYNKLDGTNELQDGVVPVEFTKSNRLQPAVESYFAAKEYENNASAPEEELDEQLSFLPKLMASAKKVALQSMKEMKDKVQEDAGLGIELHDITKEDVIDEVDGTGDLEIDSDNDNVNIEINL